MAIPTVPMVATATKGCQKFNKNATSVLKMASDWSVYMILASDRSLYTGISTDVERRFLQHQSGAGAKYFHAGRRPEQVVYREVGHDRSSASRREAAIKKLPRSEKLRMAENCTGELSNI